MLLLTSSGKYSADKSNYILSIHLRMTTTIHIYIYIYSLTASQAVGKTINTPHTHLEITQYPVTPHTRCTQNPLCVFFPSFWTSSSLDVPAGVTQEEGHTGFFIHLLSAVRALMFLARRIQPFLSLVDREVEFCVLTTLIVLHPLVAHFYIFFLVFKWEKSRLPGPNSYPNVSEGYEVPLSYRGDRHHWYRVKSDKEVTVVL